MDVETPQGRQRENLAGQHQSVGDDHQHLRLPVHERRARLGAAQSLRLRERQMSGERRALHRARGEFAAAAPGPVRLRQNPDDAVSREQRREGWQREFRRAGKGDAQHYQPVGLADPKPWQ